MTCVLSDAERALCLMLQDCFQIVSLFQQKWLLGVRVSYIAQDVRMKLVRTE